MSSTQLEQASLNRLWARLILLSLYRQGVRHFFLAPGSRSTPLTLEAAILAKQHADLCLHTHFDERGLGFLALGMAKTTDAAVAVIVTSGTAVANLLPAVVESGLIREKLILLTADRPQELIECGANQAISQHNIFSNHVVSACYLPSPSKDICAKWLLGTLSENLVKQEKLGGSIHINCPYPEPLYGEPSATQQAGIDSYLKPVKSFLLDEKPHLLFIAASEFDFSVLADLWQTLGMKKGIVILGNIKEQDKISVNALAHQLGWPVLADVQSGIDSEYSNFDLWLQNSDCLQLLKESEFILQCGARIVSKRLGQFLANFHGEYWLVDENAGRVDPYHLQAVRLQLNLAKFSTWLVQRCITNPWATRLKIASEKVRKIISLCDRAKLSELTIAHHFGEWIANDSALFIGNSLIVRLLDMAGKLPQCAVYSNRGASGIDGLLATAQGVQRGIQQPMICVLGDVSALYDLNSLALLAHCSKPFVLIIINNDGCGIFDLLPVPNKHKEAYYRISHNLNFSHAASMFGVNYYAPKTLNEAKAICLEAQKDNEKKFNATLIELMVPAGEAGHDLQFLFTAVRDAKLI